MRCKTGYTNLDLLQLFKMNCSYLFFESQIAIGENSRTVYITHLSLYILTFCSYSGLLLSYLTLKALKKGDGKLKWGLFYFHRFYRITPLYMFVLGVSVTLPIHIGKKCCHQVLYIVKHIIHYQNVIYHMYLKSMLDRALYPKYIQANW